MSIMAGWIKVPLGTEVGLGPDNIMLDEDPDLPTERGTAAPPPLLRYMDAASI